ncbi:fimbrin-1 [Anaeramoeba ignava]|uniref:Fimbrin-1 n=1 Tax=Anaeramoeba ignava TaxID=1746090 RepID=A0A9Q0LAM9_ANAIG|nr:fimbrin-1 [Anaeramoeba ignava]
MQNKLQENEKEQQMKFVVLRNQVERIKNKEKALKRQLESSETQIKQLNEVMAEKERILQQEQQMREAYSNSNRELKEKLLTIQEETESKISSLTLNYEQKITQNMNEINELKNEKNLAIEEKEQQHKIEMEDFKFKMRTQSQQLIETQEKILFLETQLTREQNENEEITKKLTEKMEEEKEKDQQKLEQALEIFEETKKSLIKEQKLREKLESEQKQLQEKLEMMSAEIYSEKQERETMEEEKTKLSSITTSLSAENVTLKKKLEHIIALDHAFSPREISNTSFEHEIDLLEMSMIRYINHTFKYDRHLVHILPIGTKTPSLAGAILDGVLLCKLINHAVPGTLDERALTIISPTEEQIVENHTLCLNSAQSIGCDVFAITVDDLVSGVDNVVIALAWEITIAGLLSTISLEKHPEILCLFSENEKMQSIKDMPPEKLLMRWVNYHLKQANSSRVIKNFAEDLRDSECLLILLNQLSPKRCPLDEYSEDMDYESRAELVVSNAAKLNCPFFVSVSNIVSADYSELNIAFLAKLFHTRSGLKVSSEDINLRILDYTALGTREERAFRIWINTFGFEPRVTALYKDLRNGIVVLKILDKIKPGFVDWKHVNTDFSNIYQEIENCNYAIEVGKKLGLRLVNISGTDIFNGSQTLLLGFLWQTMEFHLKNILSELKVIKSGKITDTEMVEWANAQIKSAGKSSQVSSLKDPSIKSGLFFVDLVFAIKSSFVNYDFVQLGDSSQEYMNNALYAITLCRKLGANIFVIPEDIVEVKPKMLLTIIGELMRIHKQLN